MYLDCSEYIKGDFKFIQNIYKSEDEFTVYYQSFPVGIINTQNFSIGGGNSPFVWLKILNANTFVCTGTVTIRLRPNFNSKNNLSQKGEIYQIELNMHSCETLSSELVNKRSVILEKSDKMLENKLFDSYFERREEIIMRFYNRGLGYNLERNMSEILIVDYPSFLGR